MRRTTAILFGAVLTCLFLRVAYGDDRFNEVPLSAADFQKLDTFEGVLLAKGDKSFAVQEWRRAAADYDAFLLQYPKSLVVPYALLRKGRALQHDKKRYDALKVYNEIVDYFPNAVEYAGAALYYIGECHAQNGDAREAMKAWAEMAQDKDYRKHVLAAGAINQLADNLVKQDKWEEAAAYYGQVSVDFRRSHREEARAALARLQECYIRVHPDESKLHAAYVAAETFDPDPRKPDDTNYWTRVMGAIARFDTFKDGERPARQDYYRYWARAMEGRFPDWDDFQINLAAYHRRQANDDTAFWMARLDDLYAKGQKEGDFSRTIKWLGLFAGYKPKVDAYYAKLPFDKMSNQQIVELIQTLYDRQIDMPLARHSIGHLKADQMTDDACESLARWIWTRDEEGMKLLCDAMRDGDRGRMTMLRFYRDTHQPDKGLKLADGLIRVPLYAKESLWSKAELLREKRQWTEAVAVYKLADNPPENLYRIADCLLADNKRDAGLAQLREIEGFFPKEAAEAAWRIARVWQQANDRKQSIAALRAIMKKYPASPQSCAADLELKHMGVKPGGGIDAE